MQQYKGLGWAMSILCLSGCSAVPLLGKERPTYHLSGWSYSTGTPMYMPYTNINKSPPAETYGVTHYSSMGVSGY